jgi:hypothetical protein
MVLLLVVPHSGSGPKPDSCAVTDYPDEDDGVVARVKRQSQIPLPDPWRLDKLRHMTVVACGSADALSVLCP